MRMFFSDGTWFVRGTQCRLVEDCGLAGGIFKGWRTKQFESESDRAEIGEDYLDEELCQWEEFGCVWDDSINSIRQATQEELDKWNGE